MNASTLSPTTLPSSGQSESQNSELSSSGTSTSKILSCMKAELQVQKQQRRLAKELHLKRVQFLRKELEFLKATEWRYQPIDRESVEPNISEVISRIQDAENEDPPQVYADIKNEEGCFYTTGKVTVITGDYILIDDLYMCDMANVLVGNVKVDDKVYYMAFQRNKNEDQRVRKIISVVDDSWDNEVAVEQSDTTKDVATAKMMKKMVVGKVTSRAGRIAFVEPVNVSIDLDKVASKFVPVVGDWLQLECLVEVDENSDDLGGEILEVDSIQPLRSKLIVGIVTNYDIATGIGAIERNIAFHKTSCEPGYVPYVGDKVVTDNVESDQGICTWRSVTVVPLVQVTQRKDLCVVPTFKIPTSQLDVLVQNKRGIVIADDLKFDLKVNEESDLVVLIKNTVTVDHVLYKSCFMSKKAESQLSLKWPSTDTTTVLKPFDTISYIFKCKARFVGATEELFIFSFQGFKIGRIFRVNVHMDESLMNKNNLKASDSYRANEQLARQDNFNKSMFVAGIKPVKPPAFITVRSGVFNVPQRFWDAVLGPLNEKKSQIEREIAIGDAAPCLLSSLSFENYTDRFHALLYLEEISQSISTQQYDMNSASMRHSGEYLILTVPGLAEKRPSLITGDRAIVSFKWDSSKGNLKYEGYIHKIRSSEILLKFDRKLHERYNCEDCQVTFKCSTSSIRRCHTAVNLAVTHLGSEFLFPVRVVQKEPQLNLEEEEVEEKAKCAQFESRRSQSLSSVSSGISGRSNSDSSSESTVKSPPRISVAERLFSAKTNRPIVPNKSAIHDVEKLPASSVCKSRIKEQLTDVATVPNATAIQDPHSKQLDPYVSQLKKRKLAWFNKSLNYFQKEAVRNVLMGLARPLPYVVFGPPGTGKTITLCETVMQIFTTIPESRLLVATPSNSSANLITERLLDSGVLKPGDLVRLVAHRCLEDDSIPDRLLPYCATADLAAERSRPKFKYSGEGPKINATASVLGRHRITVGTCVALGILYNVGFPRGHFSHVLVDEAGQATEPEILIPLNFIHSSYGQVVLAGDPMQLGPVVQSKLASHYGFGESFLSRLLHRFPYQRDPDGFETGYDPRLVTKLVFNYRSLPEILELPNSLFYDGELRPQISPQNSKEADLLRSLADELPEREGMPPALVFHGIKGENYRDSESPSWYNPQEAAQVYFYMMKLYNHGLRGEDVGIITPYQKQVRQIRDLFLELDVELPKVGSVEEFQGQERKVIILSTVRSTSNLVTEDIKHSLGFVASPKRLNVAITRARTLLIIVGNPQLLVQDPYWRSVLIYCVKNNAYRGFEFISADVQHFLIDSDEETNDL